MLSNQSNDKEPGVLVNDDAVRLARRLVGTSVNDSELFNVDLLKLLTAEQETVHERSATVQRPYVVD